MPSEVDLDGEMEKHMSKISPFKELGFLVKGCFSKVSGLKTALEDYSPVIAKEQRLPKNKKKNIRFGHLTAVTKQNGIYYHIISLKSC